MAKAVELGSGFVIRSRVDRIVKSKYGEYARSIYENLDLSHSQGQFPLKLPARQGQASRVVQIDVKFREFVMPVPKAVQKNTMGIQSFPIFVVELKEVTSNGKSPLHWILLTSEPVYTFEDAVKIAEWYKARWTIEVFHKTLKSGMKIEECRLGNVDRLFKYISLASILAFRILYLANMSRFYPDESCDSILSEIEWKVLLIRSRQTLNIGDKAPSLIEATTMIAQMGGYLARKNDPPPGPIVLWRGMKALGEWVQMYKLLICG